MGISNQSLVRCHAIQLNSAFCELGSSEQSGADPGTCDQNASVDQKLVLVELTSPAQSVSMHHCRSYHFG